MSLDSLCRWQVQVSVYYYWRIPAHLRCTQCSILLHLTDICCLTCICLWQISQIQTCLFKVVGPGLVSTSPAFVGSSAAISKSDPHCWGRGGSTQFAQQLESAVTAPPLVGCVVWRQKVLILLSCHQTAFFHLSTHLVSFSLHCRRSSKVQGCAGNWQCNISLVVSGASPHLHVVSPLKYIHLFRSSCHM